MDDRSVKVLVVEDSRSAAMALTRLLAPFEVVGVAGDGREALRLQARLKPDVITMDIHLPDTNGLVLTREILARRAVPIVIISALVSPERQGLVFEALKAGAYDVVAKSRFFSQGDRTRAEHRLTRLIRAAAGRHRAGPPPPPPAGKATRVRLSTTPTEPGRCLVAIGASTGGPAALRSMFESLHFDFPLPILVAQHMSEGFIEGFARWLDTQSAIRACIATDGLGPRPATAYFAPSGQDLGVAGDGKLRLTPSSGPGPSPSVNRLFSSVARVYGSRAICLLLTGMGSDGADGLLAAKKSKALCAVQDQETSVIFGMPGAAVRVGAADVVLPLNQIPGWLTRLTTG